MFELSFGEIVVVAVVALIVIGPERLPRVARGAGVLLGRLQRFVSGVKAEFQRDMNIQELRQLQAEVQETAATVEAQLRQSKDYAEDEFQRLERELIRENTASKDTLNEQDYVLRPEEKPRERS